MGRRSQGFYAHPIFGNRRIIMLLSQLLCGVLVGALGFIGYRYMVAPDFRGEGHGSIIVRVPVNATASELTPELIEKGVIKSGRAYRKAMAAEPRLSELQPGFYQLHKEMSASHVVATLIDPHSQVGHIDIPNGAVLNDVHPLRGIMVKGIFSMIADASCINSDGNKHCITVEELKKAVSDSSPEELGVPSWATEAVHHNGKDPQKIEGLIHSGVHDFNPSTTPREILHKLIDESVDKYEAIGINEPSATHLSPYQILISASLVERESHEKDFSKVARVIANRLAKNMKLQFDSTVNYGLAAQEIATTDADRNRETKWNTYVKTGLPFTPISSPSNEAVEAVRNPERGKWLYFVTIDSQGTTRFNETFEGHNADIELSRRNGVLDSHR